uniref:Uncharacterized protein n=1 Tax=Rhizophora mucronata TaxID=61149 RepID=A0A2P2IYC5_RHIMU
MLGANIDPVSGRAFFAPAQFSHLLVQKPYSRESHSWILTPFSDLVR